MDNPDKYERHVLRIVDLLGLGLMIHFSGSKLTTARSFGCSIDSESTTKPSFEDLELVIFQIYNSSTFFSLFCLCWW